MDNSNNLRRNLRFGNTEETYRFCPEEILYMTTVYGEEKTKVHLINNDCYILPNGLGYVKNVIHASLLETDNTMTKIGRSTIFNATYLSDIGTNTIRLVADVDGQTIETYIDNLPAAACKEIAETKGLSKAQKREYQRKKQAKKRSLSKAQQRDDLYRHFENGYNFEPFGGRTTLNCLGFMVEEKEPRECPESDYDIDDDEIMFLGV